MINLKSEVNDIMYEETDRANREHKPYVDMHHAYGVLAEEMHEFLEDYRRLNNTFDNLVKCLQKDDVMDYVSLVTALQEHAIHCACEAIQVAAVCQRTFECLGSKKPTTRQDVLSRIIDFNRDNKGNIFLCPSLVDRNAPCVCESSIGWNLDKCEECRNKYWNEEVTE